MTTWVSITLVLARNTGAHLQTMQRSSGPTRLGAVPNVYQGHPCVSQGHPDIRRPLRAYAERPSLRGNQIAKNLPDMSGRLPMHAVAVPFSAVKQAMKDG